jgi:hypothetical protein
MEERVLTASTTSMATERSVTQPERPTRPNYGRVVILASTLRRIILGEEGPWADPRTATDTIDNLAELVREIGDDEDAMSELVEGLLRLLRDDDPVVRTGAALGLRLVRHELDGKWFIDDVEESADLLDVAPSGFAGASTPTILDLVLELLAGSLQDWHDLAIERTAVFLDRVGAHDAMVMAMARSAPNQVVHHAEAWIRHDDTGVLVLLPTLSHRLAVARALAPWPPGAAESVAAGGRLQGWADEDTRVLLAAMAGG